MDINSLQSLLEQFHFIRPEWLWSLPLAILLWLILKNLGGDHQWSNHIPKEMLAALQISSAKQSSGWKWALLFLWLGVITAAAGPSWDKQAAPTVQNQKALVLILDLSPSMLVQDLRPDRLTLAKYKLIDVLRQQADGQAALIAYAGDAHTVSPLTDDPQTIEALLPALHPDVMPSQGSNTEAAIDLAQQLMADAGLRSGEILLISDGVSNDAIRQIRRTISSNYALSILAVGGLEGAQIPASKGGFVRRANGEIVLSSVNASEMQSLATNSGGRFSLLSADDSDIESLQIGDFDASNIDDVQQSDVVYDAWVDMGHWLVLFMLPLALLLFRKGVIYLLVFCAPVLMLVPKPVYAADFSWQDLWQTKDQQAYQQYQAEDFKAAANTFKRKDWSAIANYKNEDYQTAIDKLKGKEDLVSLYNMANALAFSGQLAEAVESYDKVLEKDPTHEDATHNKSVIEQLMQQQEQNQQQQGQDSSESNSDQQQEQNQQSQDQQQQNSEQDKQNSDAQNSENSNSDKQQASQSQDSQDQADENSSEPEPSDSEQQGPEQAKQPEKQNAELATEPGDDEADKAEQKIAAQIGDTTEPLKDSSEQWLRTIQDDPSGLLRRKFDYQARQRAQQRTTENQEQERY